jgi:hypothetical protein
MTIINNTFGFIFVHIPKCGGTSVSIALSRLAQFNDIELGGTPYGQTIDRPYRSRFGIHKHSTAAEIRNVVGRSLWGRYYTLWGRYYTFGLVRNPYRRAISAYTFLKTHEKNYQFMAKFQDLNAWVQSESWGEAGPDNINLPQHRWLTDASRVQMIDEVFHLEDVITDLKPLLRRLRLNDYQTEHIRLCKDNPSQVRIDPDTIEDRTIDLIRSRYEADFTLFGYSTHFRTLGLR